MNKLTPIGQGRTADVYTYEEGKILKLYRPGFPKEAIHQEYIIAKLVCSLGLSVPQTYELIDFEDRTGIVLEYVRGTTLLQQISSKPWSVSACARLMAETHYHIHQYQADMPRNQQDILREAIGYTSMLEDSEKQDIYTYMDTLPKGNRLCHGDFHPDNILVGRKNWVIDWMTGMSGDPAGDVARTTLLLSLGSMPEGIPAVQRGTIQFLRNRLMKAYLRHYLKLSGITKADVDRWQLPVAAARLAEGIPETEKQALVQLIRKSSQRR